MNERLLELCGLELVEEGATAEEDEDNGTQANGTQASQGGTQASKGPKGNAYMLVNRLENAIVPEVRAAEASYRALVEVVLGLIKHNEGELEEQSLFENWLPKLGLKETSVLSPMTMQARHVRAARAERHMRAIRASGTRTEREPGVRLREGSGKALRALGKLREGSEKALRRLAMRKEELQSALRGEARSQT